jgi:hypothetical protein
VGFKTSGRTAGIAASCFPGRQVRVIDMPQSTSMAEPAWNEDATEGMKRCLNRFSSMRQSDKRRFGCHLHPPAKAKQPLGLS